MASTREAQSDQRVQRGAPLSGAARFDTWRKGPESHPRAGTGTHYFTTDT